jgi:hypothetical protein
LVEATVQEIAALADCKVTHSESSGYYTTEAVKVGTIFNVKEAFAQIHRNDKRKNEVATVKQQLQAIITQLDMVEPYLEEPKPETPAAPTEEQ